MNTPKKILMIIVAFLVLLGISGLFAFALLMMFNINFWGTFLLVSLIQFIIPTIVDKLTFSKNLKNAIKEYNEKPYKKYRIPLICQYCGNHEDIDVDLTDTTYKCNTCQRTNAIYVTFTTAVISLPEA